MHIIISDSYTLLCFFYYSKLFYADHPLSHIFLCFFPILHKEQDTANLNKSHVTEYSSYLISTLSRFLPELTTIFPSSLPVSNFSIKVGLLFFLLPLIPVTIQAETVYITDSLLVGLHEEKSIDSPILKVLPTGTTLEVIERDDDFIHVRDPKGVSGWISNSYLISNNPDKNEIMDEGAAQSKIRELEAELQNIKLQQAKPDQETIINADEIAKLKNENKTLKQKIKSDKLKSGELQANLAELRNQISQAGDNNKLSSELQLLAEKNAGLEDEIKQLQKGSNTEVSGPNNSKLSNLIIGSGIALLAGLLFGIFIMDWLQRRRHGGLRY